MSMYIYQMPYSKYLKLQKILDIRDEWKKLAEKIGTFSIEDIEYIELDAYKPSQSPSNHLLQLWGHSNPTVMDLFRHLKAMKNERALRVLQDLVPNECFLDKCDKDSLSSSINQGVKNSKIFDTSDLPSSQWGTTQTGNQFDNSLFDMPSGTPVPPYQSQYVEHSLQKDPNRHPTAGYPVNYPQETAFVHNMALSVVPEFKLVELNVATSDFSKENIIGCGGFGTVYHGKLQRFQQEVAIKKLKKQDEHELTALFRCHHSNIINLLGYCQSNSDHYLIYDFMHNGSLLDRLMCKDNTVPLTSVQRINILSGAAKAVNYLHNLEPLIIHGDIKSANILLDEHFRAKVADFGLAKQVNSGGGTKHTHVSQRNERIYGSCAYLPHDYLEDPSKLRKEVDTFSFGIVTFETCFGVRADEATQLSKGQYTYLKDLMDSYRDITDFTVIESKMKDPRCQTWRKLSWQHLLQLGFQCTVMHRKKRPSMAKVADELERIMNNLQPETVPAGSNSIQENLFEFSAGMFPQNTLQNASPLDKELEDTRLSMGSLNISPTKVNKGMCNIFDTKMVVGVGEHIRLFEKKKDELQTISKVASSSSQLDICLKTESDSSEGISVMKTHSDPSLNEGQASNVLISSDVHSTNQAFYGGRPPSSVDSSEEFMTNQKIEQMKKKNLDPWLKPTKT